MPPSTVLVVYHTLQMMKNIITEKKVEAFYTTMYLYMIGTRPTNQGGSIDLVLELAKLEVFFRVELLT